MDGTVRYGTIDFDPGFFSATDHQGVAIRFSRAERLLLTMFCENPHAVLMRERMLDAISGVGSDTLDRNIDYVINRLRRKLGDSARRPRYIETRYGDGYVWIAERIHRAARSSGAFLVIGPLRGLRHSGRFATHARSCAMQLQSDLSRRMAADRRVVIDEDCAAVEDYAGDKPEFAVELSFLDFGGRLDCVSTVKVFGTGQILRVARRTVATGRAELARLDRKIIEAGAGEVAEAVWDRLAFPGSHQAPSEEALPVRIHAAAEYFAGARPWQEADRRLRNTVTRDPKDFQARVMLATNLHSKYLMSGPIMPEADNRAHDEDEMEALVLASLPHLQANPIFMMAAAKLLYFLDRGHRPLAVEMAEQAFRTTTAFATSFATFGQMRMFQGETGEAVIMFDRGLELVPAGSYFEGYLLTLKCQALLAAGDRPALAAAFESLCLKAPGARTGLSIFFSPFGTAAERPEAQLVVDAVDERRARAMLLWVHYVCGRLFRSVEHRQNVLAPSTRLLVRRFGPDVVPAELRRSAPALLDARTARGGAISKETSRPGAVQGTVAVGDV